MIDARPLRDLFAEYPVARDFFSNLNIPSLDASLTPAETLRAAPDEQLAEFGLTRSEIPAQLARFLEVMTTAEAEAERRVSSLTVIGGIDKDGEPENIELCAAAGSVIGVVGPTGSGKSRLLGDIECLAQGDTPTRRRILIDGAPVDEDERFRLGGGMVAQLSQNMNFVMDLTVAEFLDMHARSRAAFPSASANEPVKDCFCCANALAGERFTLDTKVTQLSGGQSRALMIADCAYMSRSAVVLIDEIENAGVDRTAAIAILARAEKIVLISTHDPLLALGADRRVVIKNGGVRKVIDTSDEEKEYLREIKRMDRAIENARRALRSGARVAAGDAAAAEDAEEGL
jgi:ABC-type lipoprotein export system ATPase subunit